MMDGLHPSDIELFEYAEGELSAEAAGSVREHLASCEICVQELAAVERARTVLRASPLLDLPEERVQAMIEQLPPQDVPASEQRRFLFSRTRLLAVLTPAALATAAVIALVIVTRDGSDSNQPQAQAIAAATETSQAEAPAAGGPETVEASPAPTDSAAEEAPTEDAGGDQTFSSEAARKPALEVQGPPRAVVAILTAAAIDAKVVDGTVEARGATQRELEQALAGRPSGPVAVFLEP
jgi:anti-sigma factor RsiW